MWRWFTQAFIYYIGNKTKWIHAFSKSLKLREYKVLKCKVVMGKWWCSFIHSFPSIVVHASDEIFAKISGNWTKNKGNGLMPLLESLAWMHISRYGSYGRVIFLRIHLCTLFYHLLWPASDKTWCKNICQWDRIQGEVDSCLLKAMSMK